MKKYLFPIIFILLIIACKESKKIPRIDNSSVSIKVVRFDNDLFETPIDAIEQKILSLREKYALFFELYNEGIIGVGNSHDPEYPNNLKAFLTNETVKMAREKTLEVFPNDEEINKPLTDAFRYYNYYFPKKTIPTIFTYISGFNQSIMLADNVIGIGLDKYLGSDYEVYPMLGLSRYLSKNMKKEKIPSDCMRAWAIGEWPLDYNNSTLLSKMLYEGKLIYFATQVLPNESDSLLLGFSKDQLKWCEENEKNMWMLLVEQKLLFSTEHFTIVKLTEDAPNTSIFPPESPGRACNWIGYNIVKSYMKRNETVSLADLMENENYQAIFDQSKYKPAK